MARDFTISCPMTVKVGKKKLFLNLNVYRNEPFHINNNMKKEFKNIIKDSFPEGVYFDKFSLEYTAYLPDKRARDINNVCSIVDKFFADALVELGHAPDDNYTVLQKITYKFGGYDENNEGYVLAKVIEEE